MMILDRGLLLLATLYCHVAVVVISELVCRKSSNSR